MITGIRLYITYIKVKPETGERYVGMASGLTEEESEESANQVLTRRENAPHHKNKEGFEKGEVDKISTDRNAIRGREQMLYEHFEKKGTITSQNQPVSPRNKKRTEYLKTALAVFGDILIIICLFNIA